MTERLLEETSRVVEIALASGAETAVAAMTQKSEFQVEVRNGEIESLAEADFHSVSLTVSVQGKRASVSSCDLSAESITMLVEQALSMCRYTDHDPFYSLPEEALLAREVADLDIFDPAVVSIGVDEKIARALELERAMLARDPRLRSESCSVSTVTGTTVLANSIGFCQPKKSSLIYLSASAFAEDPGAAGDLNTGRKQTAGWTSRARYLEDLESVEAIAEQVSTRVLRKLGARKPPSGRFPVYFEPAMARSLWDNLSSAISGAQIYRHESYLAGRLGQEVCSPLVTICDEPLLRRGLGSRAFDAEGVVCQPRCLVNAGQLETYLMSTYSAKKLGMRSTGHASGTSNLVVTPGQLGEDALICAMGRGVWLTSLLGQGVNLSTGDYSRGAFGLWVEDGVVQYPIMEFTVNSNLDQMLKGITHIGNNVHARSTVQTPGIVIGEMSIGGT